LRKERSQKRRKLTAQGVNNTFDDVEDVFTPYKATGEPYFDYPGFSGNGKECDTNNDYCFDYQGFEGTGRNDEAGQNGRYVKDIQKCGCFN
jgi:hypothetical protein